MIDTRIDNQRRDTHRLACGVECKLAGVWVVIPAKNEQAAIAHVLQDLPPVGRVIVVDNGSTDETAEAARCMGADVVHEKRPGYGSACLAGLARIEMLVAGGEPAPQIIVFLDADYSDHPEELPQLVEPILRGEADFVLGSRLLGRCEAGAMSLVSVYGNKLACFLMWLFWGVRYTDLGPFRALSYSALQQLGMQDTNFGWTVEMQIKAALAKLRTREIPVRYRRRIGVSKISGTVSGTFRAGYKILFTIARYWWQTWRRK
jgi:glycosyltransferase involved in cell wall biosynthesis